MSDTPKRAKRPTDLKAVPRPPAPAQRPGLIDISKAPSGMEAAAKRWSEGR